MDKAKLKNLTRHKIIFPRNQIIESGKKEDCPISSFKVNESLQKSFGSSSTVSHTPHPLAPEDALPLRMTRIIYGQEKKLKVFR